ncbi:serine/threonine-protein kinase [Shewanella colwelliana]|nr:serine/threonine-protein kinase [Shewanella colwelliana]
MFDELDMLFFDTLSRETASATGFESAKDLVGARIKDEFTLTECISVSGCSAIYKGIREGGDTDYSQQVAVKVIFPIIESILGGNALAHEAQLLANCRNNNIVKIITATRFIKDGFTFPCLIMEFISGKNLLEYTVHNNLNFDERLDLFFDVCSAVSYLHSRPIVHGDIKPENILVDDDGTVKIVDFTLGVTEATVNNSNHLMTRAYASPTQMEGETATVACDIFALGILLQHLILGRRNSTPARKGDTPAKLRWFKRADLNTIITKATNIDPELRYKSVDAFALDLNALKGSFPLQSEKSKLTKSTLKLFVRKPLATVSVLTAIGLLSGSYYSNIVSERNLHFAHEQLKSEYLATQSVTTQISRILKMANVRYSKGEPLSADMILKEAKSISQDQSLPMHFRFQLLLKYGETYEGVGNLNEAIRNFEEATALADEYVGKLDSFSYDMQIQANTKLSLAYFENNQPLKAKKLLEVYVYDLIENKRSNRHALNMLLAYFKVHSVLIGALTADNNLRVALLPFIKQFLEANESTLSIEEKARLSFEYATAVYYSFTGDAFSITSGESESTINNIILPAMRNIKPMLEDSMDDLDETHYLFPDIVVLLAKVNYELRNYDEAVRLGQLAITSATKIYQTTDHPAVLRIYTKYYSVVANSRYDLALPIVEELYRIQSSFSDTNLGLITGLSSSVWFEMGQKTRLDMISELYSDDEVLNNNNYSYIELESLACNTFNKFSIQSLPYPIESMLPQIKLSSMITQKQYGTTADADPLARARILIYEGYRQLLAGEPIDILPFDELVSVIKASEWTSEMFVHFSSIFANAGETENAYRLLNVANEYYSKPNAIFRYDAQFMIYNIGVGMVYSQLHDIDNVNKHLAVAKRYAQKHNFTTGVHIASIHYLEAVSYYNLYQSTKRGEHLEQFDLHKSLSTKLLNEQGFMNNSHPILESFSKMKT